MEKIVYYSDFGAKGDGKTNDFYSMKAAHAYANEIGAKVLGDAGAKYYISKTAGESIYVKTDTDFCGAEIIIDDSEIAPNDAERANAIFIIKSEYEPITFDKNGAPVKVLSGFCPIDESTKSIPFAPGYPAMIVPYDEGKKVYKRLGATSNDGADQHELIVIDKYGVIDENTPVLLPYENITKLVVYRIDDAPITFENVKITTIANKAPREYTYYARNILIKRSNTTIRNIEHYIVGEGDTGAPYSGFINPTGINNLLVEDCILSGHKFYKETSGRSWMGTYDIGGGNANNITYKNCRQVNFFKEDGTPNNTLWGIMGTNYCKNITYDGCLLSRFDAHAGIYNATIVNSTVSNLRLTGGGKFTFKNSTMYGNLLASLREDYGCTWHGDAIIENVKIINTSDVVYLFTARFYPHHNFGYQAYYPENVTVKGLTLENPAKLYVYNDITPDGEYDVTAEKVTVGGEEIENVNQMVITKNITLEGLSENVLSVEASPDSVFNSQLKITRK